MNSRVTWMLAVGCVAMAASAAVIGWGPQLSTTQRQTTIDLIHRSVVSHWVRHQRYPPQMEPQEMRTWMRYENIDDLGYPWAFRPEGKRGFVIRQWRINNDGECWTRDTFFADTQAAGVVRTAVRSGGGWARSWFNFTKDPRSPHPIFDTEPPQPEVETESWTLPVGD